MALLPWTKKSFVQTMATAVGARVSPATKALIVAHAAYESGWGKGLAFRKGNNPWNLTAGASWGGSVVSGGDEEFVPGSTTPKKITQRFRAYSGLSQAVADYLSFLGFARYAEAKSKLLAGDPTFVIELGANTRDSSGTIVNAWPSGMVKGGFYTLPIPDYVGGFNSILTDVETILAADALTV